MQGCGYQLAVCRAITHGLMPAVAHSCKVGYGGGLYNSIRTSSHPEDGEKTPASYLSRQAQGGHAHVTHMVHHTRARIPCVHPVALQLTGHMKHVCARMPFEGLNYGPRAPFTTTEHVEREF